MKKAIYILFVICIGISACRDPFFPEYEENRKIVLECALSAGEDPRARVHLTNPIIDTSESYFYPDTAEITFINVEDPLDVGRMSWESATGLYVSESTPILEGNSYEITINVESKDVEPIYAITTVPFADKLETVIIDGPPNLVGDTLYFDLNVSVEIPNQTDPTTYYQLITEIKNGELASAGIDEYEPLTRNQVKVLSNQNAIKQFIHKNGIFIDNSRLDDNTLDLVIEFNIPSEYMDLVDSVSFTLYTVNREYMVYHEKTDREIRISALPIGDPEISENNIQNGYGLFGAYSSSTLVVPIQ